MEYYFDNAATTRVRPEVAEAVTSYIAESYGNPSSLYKMAQTNKNAVEKAREQVAGLIGAEGKEIYFTSGGSEADNWALKSVADMYSSKGKHIITSAIEHHAIIHTCQFLAKHGYEITYLPVDEDGKVSPEALEKAIRPDTILVSVMFANNEIGTIEPIAELCEVAHKHDVLFHTDAVQAVGHIEIDVKKLGVDLLSMSAHKFYAPKGVGALYIRSGLKLEPLIHGGAQEKNRRAGTENVAGIVGMGLAAELASKELKSEIERQTKLRDMLIDGILEQIHYTKLNGHRTDRLPGNANFSFRYVEGESILILLDMQGICASSGSACASGSLDPSHVLLAIGLPHEIAHGSIRFSIGHFTTEEEVKYVLEKVPPIITRLREMSPLYEEVAKAQK
jgi:cysteine desulfurase